MHDDPRTARHESPGGDDVTLLRLSAFLGNGDGGGTFEAVLLEQPHFAVDVARATTLTYVESDRVEKVWVASNFGAGGDLLTIGSFSTVFIAVRQGGQWYAVAKLRGVLL